MEQYQVPVQRIGDDLNRQITVSVPGSKSITNRALLLAALAEGTSTLRGVLFSDDSRHFLRCLESLGVNIQVDEEKKMVTVAGCRGRVPNQNASVYVGSAGTAARFLAAFLGIAEGTWRMDASAQMRKRPMKPLLDTLQALGAGISCEAEEGHFPFLIQGAGLLAEKDGKLPIQTAVNIDNSSQFLSALLISLGIYSAGAGIRVEGSHGMAYIRMTLRMMEQFGVKTDQKDHSFWISGNQKYAAGVYEIEPDVSAACYFYAMAPLLGIRVTVPGVHWEGLQGDVEFLRILEQMGCQSSENETGICIKGPSDGHFHGVSVDMSRCSDQAITLAAIAPYADSPTVITGIGHIRYQESNRIAAICNELHRMGIHCEELEDGIRIEPGIPQPAVIETYEDHRMAMGFSLTGLRADGIVIRDPLCCRKTFEEYFTVLDQVIAKLN